MSEDKKPKSGIEDLDKPIGENHPVNTNAALLAEIETLKAEERRIELEERKLNIELKTAEVAKLRQDRENRVTNAKLKMQQLQAQLAQQKALQNQCTHMKGGQGAGAVLNGQGTDTGDYSVIHHILPSGRLMVLCTRCLSEWYSRDPLTGEKETEGFQLARKFPTRNGTSGSSQFWPVRYNEPSTVRA